MGLRQWEIALRTVVFVALGAIAALGLFALIGTMMWTPADIAAGAPYSALGLPPHNCPGCLMCGMWRAFSSLAHGDWAAAKAHNSLVVVVYPLVVAVTVLCLVAIVALIRRPLRLVMPKG